MKESEDHIVIETRIARKRLLKEFNSDSHAYFLDAIRRDKIRNAFTHTAGSSCGKEMRNWLPNMDLNHDKQIQRLLCYRYTIRQMGRQIYGFWGFRQVR